MLATLTSAVILPSQSVGRHGGDSRKSPPSEGPALAGTTRQRRNRTEFYPQPAALTRGIGRRSMVIGASCRTARPVPPWSPVTEECLRQALAALEFTSIGPLRRAHPGNPSIPNARFPNPSSSGIGNPGSAIRNPESRIPNLESRIPNLESRISNPESRISNLKSRISNLESRIPNLESRISNPESRISNPGWVAAEGRVRGVASVEDSERVKANR